MRDDPDHQELEWLIEAVESVLDQTVKVDLIIVENGSDYLPDLFTGTIRIMHSEKGLSCARNAGIRQSKTEFFFPLDCNDWLPPESIETAYRKRPETGFLYGSTMLFRDRRGGGDQHLYQAKPYDFREVMKMVYFPNGALQRKEDWATIGGYREDLPFLEDWDYWMTAGEKGICGTAIPELLYWYRQHGGMVGTNKRTPEWDLIKHRIQSYHSEIYRGVFPIMCCGNRVSDQPFVAPQSPELLPGGEGMVLVEYLGGNSGLMRFIGPITRTRYSFGSVQVQGWIDRKDAITGNRKEPGLLEMIEHGKHLFTQVVEESEEEPA